MLAQISEGGLPPSFLYGNNIKRGEGEPKACVYKLEEDITKLKWEDTVVEDNGGPVRVAAIIPAVIDMRARMMAVLRARPGALRWVS